VANDPHAANHSIESSNMKSVSPIIYTVLACLVLPGLAQAQAPFQSVIPSAPKLETRLTAPAKSGGIVELDRIVAIVNNEVITQNDLNERLATIVKQLQKQGTRLPPQEELRKQLLERMINDLVQQQEAKETGIKVDDGTLDKTLQRIADENNVSMTEFRRLLEEDGVRWQKFRDEIRNEVALQRLREREVEGNVNVTEAEVDTQIALEAREATTDQEFRLAHILVLVPEQATSAQIEAKRKRALQALGELRKGADFAQISAQFSDAPDALQGGNLGWRPSGRLPALFLEAINALRAGETTDILKSANGFHIVKLLDKRGRDASPTVQQTHARHILVRAKEGVTDEDAKNRLARLRERIVAGGDFAELAKVHSDDPSSTKGGDLGWMSPGDTVPEFERAMNQLRDNEISAPFQSQFGWHLVQVLERRSEGISEDRKRAAARNAIRTRKGEEAFQDWVRQARDRAFVEYRLEEK
jgi:peptidyl-prolyl cis-trans isomerase SurA